MQYTLDKPFSDRVEILVDVLRYGLNLSVQVIFDIKHVTFVVLGDEVDGETEVTEAARTTNPMKVGVRLAREVKIDDNVDGDDIDATSKDIG